MKIKKMIRTFLCSLTIPVLSVLYAGLILSALISVLAGILRTVGFEQIKMSIWHGIDLPVALSIPVSLVVSIFLIIGSLYVKRSIKFCVTNLRF
ncbi:hypothetical protein [Cytobacillus dafuensis]|uniref:Uncharacterized protein n=1 Tax=Cytobacillus dafuensis TaxID=1742359 RepID=A0A5B8ZDH7_CYTDA|nr:hypothetical protein [Cytobacillus dafuensis]QED49879.1 hypothetical protein FSZ17_22815 [Cytobacillus dafuensis]